MILELKIKNFLSFKNEVTLSFEATKDKKLEDYQVVEIAKGIRVLKLGVIYGANASGKSNLLNAFEFLRDFWFNIKESKEEETNVIEEPETTAELDLFSYEEDLYDEPSSQSFTFETEEKIQQQATENKATFTEEKPIEFSFFVNEPIEEPTVETPQPRAQVQPEPVHIPEQKVEQQIAQPKETPSMMEVEDEFTFISKPTNDRVAERRNKLKEFNSRYQSVELENEFESVPAFRRKNIALGNENASEQRINTFLSENEGRMQIRENRFLNKDVD